MGGNHHEPLSSLCPVDWTDVPKDNLKPYLDSLFTEASTVVESIPSPASKASSASGAAKKGRARSKTDSAVLVNDGTVAPAAYGPGFRTDAPTVEQALKLQDEWKEVKVNPRENPLGVQVYKLSSKDGKGAWFARRSVHEGLAFDQWVEGMKREFPESMAVDGGYGSGAIRGLGADRRVENHEVDKDTHMQVFQLSAQFPGPTSPRDFVTLFLTTTFSHTTSDQGQPLRQFMVVSKPVTHPECPARSGVIRGHYESVEIIREIPSQAPRAVRSQSALDLTNNNSAAATAKPHPLSSDAGMNPPVAIEWLMVTRSDPGGSVPRFMIEKGTPPGIVNDAKKFLDWVTRESLGNQAQGTDGSEMQVTSSLLGNTTAVTARPPVTKVPPELPTGSTQSTLIGSDGNNDTPYDRGLYSLITGALGAATNVVAGGFKAWNGTDSQEKQQEDRAELEDTDESSLSDASSIVTFTSAVERRSMQQENGIFKDSESFNQSEDRLSGTAPQQKELRRLEERRRKLDEKALKMTQQFESRRSGDKEKDAAALAKIREKHEKEVAKQEAKYKREIRKIEEKREQEERKAAERRRKAVEKEERLKLALELERVKAERDLALKQVELLTAQVGELQRQNTALVARRGRASTLDRDDLAATSLGTVGRVNSTPVVRN